MFLQEGCLDSDKIHAVGVPWTGWPGLWRHLVLQGTLAQRRAELVSDLRRDLNMGVTKTPVYGLGFELNSQCLSLTGQSAVSQLRFG